MLGDLETLPDDPNELKDLVGMMGAEIKALTLKVADLQSQVAGHPKARFGSKSETADQLALDLQEDIEIAQAVSGAGDKSGDDNSEPPAKRQHSRTPLPEHLERQAEVLTPGDICPDCGGALRPLGEDITQELAYVPGRFVVREIVRPRMACNGCDAFAQVPLLSRPIERGRAGPGLLAHILVGKYCDHLPYYRQSGIYAREDEPLERHWSERQWRMISTDPP